MTDSPLSGLYNYLQRSYDEFAKGARSARDFMDSVTPGPQFFAQMLPGAGVVQSGQDARNARAAFNQGNYGQAFGDAASSLLNAGLEMSGPIGHAAMAVAPALRRTVTGAGELERLYAAQALPAVRDRPAPTELPYPQGARIDASKPLWEMYHGTNAADDFQRFNPVDPGHRNGTPDEMAVFLSGSPAVADNYSGSFNSRGGAGPRTIPLTLDPGKTAVFDVPEMIRSDPEMQAAIVQHHRDNGQLAPRTDSGAQGRADYGQRVVDMYTSTPPGDNEFSGVPYSQGAVGAAVRVARQRGLDSAVLRGFSEDMGADQVVVLTPGRVWNALTGKLMYGAPLAAGVPALGDYLAQRNNQEGM